MTKQFKFFTSPSPHLIVNNFLSDDEINIIKSEIKSLDEMLIGDNLKEATKNQVSLRKSKGIFLSKLVKDYNKSPSMKFQVDKFITDEFSDRIEIPWVKRMYRNIKNMSFLLNKYEVGDSYKKHHDNTIFTSVLCLKDKCTGGNFFLGDESNAIELNNNDLILFFGCEEHGVSEIESGVRYSLTTFMT